MWFILKNKEQHVTVHQLVMPFFIRLSLYLIFGEVHGAIYIVLWLLLFKIFFKQGVKGCRLLHITEVHVCIILEVQLDNCLAG